MPFTPGSSRRAYAHKEQLRVGTTHGGKTCGRVAEATRSLVGSHGAQAERRHTASVRAACAGCEGRTCSANATPERTTRSEPS